ncbi:DUF2637 domain-containing protein [Micromonospora sp. 15K316]|uniref:DUF2637 domain-containing protein n=1 Tax=Micromonospora sp. 15K316 TaxID=2530376 RepID=UPI001FB5AB7F|nr:DUF2637 domain-containing protein [Micromonospora sp. 15K316]
MSHDTLASLPTADSADLGGKQLRRLRWAVRATLVLGVAASVAANVLHARPNPISQIIAAWPPLALLLTVELISRVPHHRWYLGAIRITAAAIIALIAAWVSYWHLVGVAARYGESGYGAAYLLPISVDGLVLVASVSLVEITARIRAASTRTAPATAELSRAPAAAVPTLSAPDEDTVAAPSTRRYRRADPGRPAAPATAARRPTSLHHAPTASSDGSDADGGDDPAAPRPGIDQRGPGNVLAADVAKSPTAGTGRPAIVRRAKASGPPPSETAPQAAPVTNAEVTPTPAEGIAAPSAAEGTSGHGLTTPSNSVAVIADTASAVAYWRRREPALQPAEVAARIGKSERTVRRHWHQQGTTSAGHRNGHPAGKNRQHPASNSGSVD